MYWSINLVIYIRYTIFLNFTIIIRLPTVQFKDVDMLFLKLGEIIKRTVNKIKENF